MNEREIGKKLWIVGDGFMSSTKNGDYVSHEALCVLNISGQTAHINLTFYFEDKAPMKGFTAVCENERSNHIRLDKIKTENGDTVPYDTPYSVVLESDCPIVVQHSRMDVSQAEMTLMTTIAY